MNSRNETLKLAKRGGKVDAEITGYIVHVGSLP